MLSTNIPSSWRSRMPNPYELADYLKINPPPERIAEVSQFHVERAWEQTPSWVKTLRTLGGSWYNNDPEKRILMTAYLSEQVILDGRYAESPVDMARRYQDCSLYHYGQCPKRGHFLSVSPYEGAEPAERVTETKCVETVAKTGLINAKFRNQVGICRSHEAAVCVQCARNFRLKDQEARFWTAKMSECQACLQHQLMFVEPKHNARGVILKNQHNRKLYRMTEWGLEYIPVPPGVDPPDQVQPVPASPSQPPVTWEMLANNAPWLSPPQVHYSSTPPYDED